MAERPLQIGVIGAGSVAQINHIPAWMRLRPGVQIAAVCDEENVRLEAVARKFSIPRAVSDFEQIIGDHEIDAVDICTPNHLHAPMAVAALRSGKHVLCERPMARNSQEAQSMVDAAREAQLVLMCAMNNRFRDDVQILKRFVQKGEIGDLFFIKSGWLRRGESYGWKAKHAMSGGGVVLDLGVQMLDLALWLAGDRKVASVSAQVHRPRPAAVEDAGVALLRFKGGSGVFLEVSWSMSIERDVTYLNAFGDRGAASLNPLRIHKELHGSLVNVTPAVESPRNVYKQSYAREIEHFVGCVRGQDELLSSGEDGLAILRIVEAVYASAESGKEVSLG